MSKILKINEKDIISNNEEVFPNNEKMIHKANEIIHNIPKISIESLRLLNELYYQIQIRKGKRTQQGLLYDDLKSYRLTFTQTEIKKWMGIEKYNDYAKIIEKSLEELGQTIKLKNVRLGEDYKEWIQTRFINNAVKDWENKDTKNHKMYEIEINPLMHKVITNSNLGYFTKLDLEYQSKFNTINSVRLYEYCKSFEEQSYTPPMNLELLNNLLYPSPIFRPGLS